MERDHLKGASVDAINVSQGGRIQSPARAGLAQACCAWILAAVTAALGGPHLSRQPAYARV
jgi:hypothetical protein